MTAPERIWVDGDATGSKQQADWDWDSGCWGHQQERDGDMEYIRADLVPQWQPIETAPKDGTEILGAWPPFIKRNEWTIQPVYFCCGNWIHGWDGDEDLPLKPTHWMPLPEPPKTT